MAIGYSHALFATGGIRNLVLKADKEENGGNGNGLLDGDEIKKFKADVKKEYGYDYDFSKMKQSSVKTVNIKKSDGTSMYSSISQLMDGTRDGKGNLVIPGYADNGANMASTLYLNKGDPFRQNYGRNQTAKIAYLSADDFKASKKAADEQERKAYDSFNNSDKVKEAKKKREQEAAKENEWKNANDPISKLLKRFGF